MRLLQANPEDIGDILKEMEDDVRAIHEQITEICFYMKGSVPYQDAWNLSLKEIKTIQKQLKSYFEMVKKTGLTL